MKDILPELNGKDYIEDLKKDYDIHFCREDECDDLVAFLSTYWNPNHIFVKSRRMLDFQHYDKFNKRYNFVIARNRNNNEIHSILGFIPTSQYDHEINHMMLWPAIWKSRDDIKVKGLGVSLYYYLKENLPIENISILGISSIALGIYKHWGFETGKIRHFVYVNTDMNSYHLLDNVPEIAETNDEDYLSLRKISKEEFEKAEFDNISIYKSKNYYVNRFFDHPIYRYDFYAIGDKDVMICRECGFEEHKCLRIVDYIGDIADLKKVKTKLKDLIKENNYEYIDLIEVGQNDEDLVGSGFIDKHEYEGFVVPNYFEPFELRNIDLDYAFRTINDDKPLFFKADSDQDRPNYER